LDEVCFFLGSMYPADRVSWGHRSRFPEKVHLDVALHEVRVERNSANGTHLTVGGSKDHMIDHGSALLHHSEHPHDWVIQTYAGPVRSERLAGEVALHRHNFGKDAFIQVFIDEERAFSFPIADPENKTSRALTSFDLKVQHGDRVAIGQIIAEPKRDGNGEFFIAFRNVPTGNTVRISTTETREVANVAGEAMLDRYTASRTASPKSSDSGAEGELPTKCVEMTEEAFNALVSDATSGDRYPQDIEDAVLQILRSGVSILAEHTGIYNGTGELTAKGRLPLRFNVGGKEQLQLLPEVDFSIFEVKGLVEMDKEVKVGERLVELSASISKFDVLRDKAKPDFVKQLVELAFSQTATKVGDTWAVPWYILPASFEVTEDTPLIFDFQPCQEARCMRDDCAVVSFTKGSFDQDEAFFDYLTVKCLPMSKLEDLTFNHERGYRPPKFRNKGRRPDSAQRSGPKGDRSREHKRAQA
jgi:hypothetical protein